MIILYDYFEHWYWKKGFFTVMPIQAFELELDLENITKQILEIDACCFF